jgi:hypothetical protein
MIIRGTTPYHSFVLPLLKEEIAELWFTYMQNNKVILQKTQADAELTNIVDLLENASVEELSEEELNSCQAVLHLTQEDTLKFTFWPAAEKNIIVIQVRVLTTDGEAYASDPVTERLMGVLQDGVIGGENDEDTTENPTDG